jgi:hypothetical protein
VLRGVLQVEALCAELKNENTQANAQIKEMIAALSQAKETSAQLVCVVFECAADSCII